MALDTTITLGQSGHTTDHQALHRRHNLVFDPRDYGAAVDGSSDDTAAIQECIDDSVDGSVILIPPGVMVHSTPVIVPAFRTVRGLGREKSILKAADNSNMTAQIVHKTWDDNGTSVGNPVDLVDFAIDGNRTNQSSGDGHGVLLMAWHSRIIGLAVEHCRGDGIRLTSANKAGTTISNTMVEGRLERNRVTDCGGAGIRSASAVNKATDWFLIDNLVGACDGPGIEITNEAGGWNIRGNHTYNCGLTSMDIVGCFSTIITGNYVEDANFDPSDTAYSLRVRLKSGHSTVVANNIIWSTDQTDGTVTYRCMSIEGSGGTATYQAIVTGNAIQGRGGSVSSEVGEYLTAAAAGATLNVKLDNIVTSVPTSRATGTGTVNVS